MRTRGRGAANETVWHYTIGVNLESIRAEGVLRPTSELVRPPERAAVWFTVRPNWEPTANKRLRGPNDELVLLNREQTEVYCAGLCRFGFPANVAPYTWGDHLRGGRINKRVARELSSDARALGSDPWDWRLSYEAVAVNGMVIQQSWCRDRWVETCTLDGHEFLSYLNERRALIAWPADAEWLTPPEFALSPQFTSR